jgi:hypothetical protein
VGVGLVVSSGGPDILKLCVTMSFRYVCVCVYVCMYYVCVCMYVCRPMYLCVYIYIYMHVCISVGTAVTLEMGLRSSGKVN